MPHSSSTALGVHQLSALFFAVSEAVGPPKGSGERDGAGERTNLLRAGPNSPGILEGLRDICLPYLKDIGDVTDLTRDLWNQLRQSMQQEIVDGDES